MSQKIRKILDTLCYNVLDGYALNPRGIIFEITYRCNLRCKMCGYYGEKGTRPDPKEELSLANIKKILDDICSFSPFITITGGEPLVRKDIINVLEFIKERNLKFGLITNGTLMNTDIAKNLALLDPNFINVSIDGPEMIHEKVRGNNTFNRAIEGIKLLKNNGYSKITINCVISNINFEHLVEMVNLANELDVNLQYQHLQFTDKKRDNVHKKMVGRLFNFTHDDRTSGICTELYNLDVDKLKDQIKTIKNSKINNKLSFIPDLTLDEIEKYYLDLDNYIHSKYCIYPWREARINPYGDMVYCIMEPKVGSLLNSSFKEIWNNDNMKNFRRILKKEKLFPNCARCCKI